MAMSTLEKLPVTSHILAKNADILVTIKKVSMGNVVVFLVRVLPVGIFLNVRAVSAKCHSKMFTVTYRSECKLNRNSTAC